ncbi:putative Major facilitator superfamily protein [Candidatus Terasakiella magnetica]|uniref:Putative Major facilitator superfamily protein n=1 Tax=Candidatus Terasakiella magnetica TaxID=1867952 RepID=A0A1C3RGU5_9PROT|nr:YbfB/YjiJ family MFS transporter [Candidatus Terasakiella magnetica]SCA56527.1 putative Major facilitator superfamily protein [Candidatus Terasakiella magnetica]
MAQNHPSMKLILLGGFLALIVSMGLGRFFYTPMLPLMQDGMSFSDATGGWIAGINLLGYSLGAIWVSMVKTPSIRWWLNIAGLFLCTGGTFLSGAFDNEIALTIVRFFTGLGSAFVMILSLAFAIEGLDEQQRIRASGIVIAGVGIGLALSGGLTLILKTTLSWQSLWYLGGFICLLMTICAILWLPRPAENHISNNHQTSTAWWKNKPFVLFFTAYFFGGAGYSVSATFLVDLIQGASDLSWLGDSAWIIVGLAAAPSSWLWGRAAARFGGHKTLMTAYVLLGLGVILPVFSAELLFVFLSAFLFGATFSSVVGMSMTVGSHMIPHASTQTMGVLTIAFGLGQMISPIIAGESTRILGGYDGALLMAGAACALGLIFTVMSYASLNRQKKAIT